MPAIRAAAAGSRAARGDVKDPRVVARELFDAAARHRTELVHAPFYGVRCVTLQTSAPTRSIHANCGRATPQGEAHLESCGSRAECAGFGKRRIPGSLKSQQIPPTGHLDSTACLTALWPRCGMHDGAKRFALSLWRHEPRNETARLRGGPQRPAKPGIIKFGDLIFPDKPPSRQAGNGHFWRGRSFARHASRPCDGPQQPEGERMSFCDQMAAAIDGARTLTRLD